MYRLNPFFRNFLILMSGTGLAQVIHLIISPYFSKIFTPLEYGQLGIISSLASVISILVGGRLDLAILVPKEEEKASKLFFLSLIYALAFTLILSLIWLIFKDTFLRFFKIDNLYLWFVLVLGFIIALQKALQGIFSRHRDFPVVSKGKVLHSLAFIATAFLLWKYSAFNGLIWGMGIAWLVLLLFFVFVLYKKKSALMRPKIGEYKLLLKEFYQYPSYNTLSALFIILSQSAVLWYIQKNFDTSQTGYFYHCRQYALAPISMLSLAFTQVLFENIASKIREQQSIKKSLLKLIKSLILGGSIVCLFAFVWGEKLYTLVFGDQWLLSGQYLKLLIFTFVVQTSIAPFGVVLHALNKSKHLLIFASYYLLSISLLFLIHFDHLTSFLPLYVALEISAYALHIMVVFRVINQYENHLKP